jgi:membrane protein
MDAQTTTTAQSKPIDWRSTDDVKDLGKEVYGEVNQDKVTSLAAAFAYFTVFAIPALIILSVTIAAWINKATDVQVTENLREYINEQAPASTKDLLNNIVDNAVAKVGGGTSFAAIVAVLIALWAGSAAVGALIESFNTAYGVEDSRPFLRKKGVTIGLTLLLAVFVNVAFVLLVFGRRIGEWIAEKAGLGTAFDVTWNLLRWPVAIAAIAVILAVLYYAGPDVEQSFRWISPGTVLATVLWLIATALVGIYVTFSNPGSAYGVVGSVLVLLFFLYVTGIVFILGAELNAVLARRYDPKTVRDLATRPEARGIPRKIVREQVHQA